LIFIKKEPVKAKTMQLLYEAKIVKYLDNDGIFAMIK